MSTHLPCDGVGDAVVGGHELGHRHGAQDEHQEHDEAHGQLAQQAGHPGEGWAGVPGGRDGRGWVGRGSACSRLGPHSCRVGSSQTSLQQSCPDPPAHADVLIHVILWCCGFLQGRVRAADQLRHLPGSCRVVSCTTHAGCAPLPSPFSPPSTLLGVAVGSSHSPPQHQWLLSVPQQSRAVAPRPPSRHLPAPRSGGRPGSDPWHVETRSSASLHKHVVSVCLATTMHRRTAPSIGGGM